MVHHSKNERENATSRMGKKFVKIIGLIITLALSISLARSFLQINKAKSQISQARKMLETEKKVNEDLQNRVKAVQSVQFMEEQLRDKLNMAKEGEIVVILPSPEVVKSFAPREVEKRVEIPEQNWHKWFRLFF